MEAVAEMIVPKAIASGDDAGVAAAISWCRARMLDEDELSIWTRNHSDLSSYPDLVHLTGYANVKHVTGKPDYLAGSGPVLLVAPTMDDIAHAVNDPWQGLRGYCLIVPDPIILESWISFAEPECLGSAVSWEIETPDLDPIVLESLQDLEYVNQNNTISAGREKGFVFRELLQLHDAGLPMNPETMQAWATAHGWLNDNPRLLAKYVVEINNGKRPRSSI